jgi:hypothetical protein
MNFVKQCKLAECYVILSMLPFQHAMIYKQKVVGACEKCILQNKDSSSAICSQSIYASLKTFTRSTI